MRGIRSAVASSDDECIEVSSVIRALSGLAREGPSREMLTRAGVIGPLIELMRMACSEGAISRPFNESLCPFHLLAFFEPVYFPSPFS